jgi:hypothetical protein
MRRAQVLREPLSGRASATSVHREIDATGRWFPAYIAHQYDLLGHPTLLPLAK